MATATQRYNLNQDFQLSTNSQLTSFDENEYSWTGRTLTSWIDDEGVQHLPAAIVNFSRTKADLSAKWMLDKDWKVELCAIGSGTEGSLSVKITEKNRLLPLANNAHQFISSAVLTSSGIYDGVHYNTADNELSIEFGKDQKTNIKSIKYKPFQRSTSFDHYTYAKDGDIAEANKKIMMNGAFRPDNVDGTNEEKCFRISVDYTGDGIIEYYSNDNRHNTIFKFETTYANQKCGIFDVAQANEFQPIVIDWGDGTIERIPEEVESSSAVLKAGSQTPVEAKIHTYAKIGVYYAKILNAKRCGGYRPGQSVNNKNTLTEVELGNDIADIGDQAFYDCQKIKNIKIYEKENISRIGSYAFYNCNILSNIDIPDVSSIGSYAFYKCSGLQNIEIPNSVTNIEENAFKDCSKLTEMTIPDGVSSIENGTFAGCSKLSNVSIPESVAEINESAFYNCSNLSSISIPENITDIKAKAFYGCSKLSSIDNILSNATDIGSDAFSGCSKLSSLVIPDSVSSIGENAFNGCTNLKNATVPQFVCSNSMTTIFGNACNNISGITVSENATSIGGSSFQNCGGLKKISIPDGVTSIGSGAFNGCNAQLFDTTSVVGAQLVDGWAVGNTNQLNGILNLANVRGIADRAFFIAAMGTQKNIVNVIIPSSVKNIGYEAFFNCRNIQSLTIQEGVSSIGESAFEYCVKLSSIVIPGSIKHISRYAFSFCSGLLNATISEGAESIGSVAFWNCSKLSSVSLPHSLTRIDQQAFEGCGALAEMTLHDGISSIGSSAFAGCGNWSGPLTIPSSLTHIGWQVFQGCSKLTADHVAIREGITGIDRSAFDGCIGLSGQLTFPSTLGGLGKYAFRGCSNLTGHLDLSRMGTIGSLAFQNCSGLTSVVLGQGAWLDYSDDAFEGCGLDFISVDNANWNFRTVNNMLEHMNGSLVQGRNGNVEIPEGIRRIRDRAFLNCHGLSSVTMPNSLTSIGQEAFSGCDALTNIVIGNNLSSIGQKTFYDCSSISNIVIPDNVISIDESAFGNCCNLLNITIGYSISSIQLNSFSNCSSLMNVFFRGKTRDQVIEMDNFPWNIDENIIKLENENDSVTCGKVKYKTKSNGKWLYTNSNAQNGIFNGFDEKTNAVEVIIPSNDLDGNQITSIGQAALSGCSKLKTATIPNGISEIKNHAFFRCSELINIDIPNSVLSIGNSVFEFCKKLTKITIPDGVLKIGASIFHGCDNFTNLSIPDSVTYIGPQSFYPRGEIDIHITDLTKWCGMHGADGSYNLYLNGSLVTDLTVPANMTNYMFCSCKSLTSITIPNNITNIEDAAFNGCGELKNVTIMNGVTTIGRSAFGNCNNLSSITLPDSVTTIGYGAFEDCHNLTSIVIPDSVTNIADMAFFRCNGLADNNGFVIVRNKLYSYHGPSGTVIIPNGVTTIGYMAFNTYYSTSGIQTIIIPNSVTNIGEYVFNQCNDLTNMTIPNSITFIGAGAFKTCPNLNTITIIDNGGNTGDVQSKLIAAGVKSDVNWILP